MTILKTKDFWKVQLFAKQQVTGRNDFKIVDKWWQDATWMIFHLQI